MICLDSLQKPLIKAIDLHLEQNIESDFHKLAAIMVDIYHTHLIYSFPKYAPKYHLKQFYYIRISGGSFAVGKVPWHDNLLVLELL